MAISVLTGNNCKKIVLSKKEYKKNPQIGEKSWNLIAFQGTLILHVQQGVKKISHSLLFSNVFGFSMRTICKIRCIIKIIIQ